MNEFNTAAENAKVQKIRKQYLPREENKLEQLRLLDSKVKSPGKAASIIIGVVGSLTMGAGMSLVMVWENMGAGLVLGILGMIIALLAYPIYTAITNGRKKKYTEQIFKLSDEL